MTRRRQLETPTLLGGIQALHQAALKRHADHWNATGNGTDETETGP